MIDKGGKHYEACQGRNLGQLSIEEDPEGISGRLTRLTEVQLEVKLELNEQLSAIRRELRQATQAIQAEVKTLIQEEIKTLKNALLSGITGKETSVPLDIRLADMEKGVEVTPPEDTGNTTAVEVTPQKDTGDATAKEKRSLPSHLTKLSGLTLADAYFEYVRWGLSDCTTVGKKEYSAWIDLRQLYTLARKLEPLFCEVHDPPSFDGEQLHSWKEQSILVIQEAAKRLHEKIEKFHEQNKVTGLVSRKRKLTNMALASLKRMRSMIGEE